MRNEFENNNTDQKSNTIPSIALHPETQEGREYWEMVASGSITLDEQTMDALLEKINEQRH